MPSDFTPPLLGLITDGATTPDTRDFSRLLDLIEAAVAARLSWAQLREKALPARLLYELTRRAAALTRGSATRLLVNDRADIARAAGADGVHLTTRSLGATTVRRAFGPDFIIGVSTHTPAEARAAFQGDADFIVFGPVFETPSKRAYGPPQGMAKLAEIVRGNEPLPVLALGGVNLENALQTLEAGATGVAAIGLFNDPNTLTATVDSLRRAWREARDVNQRRCDKGG
jgi:thiamine-phosphate pyrophosphorylase